MATAVDKALKLMNQHRAIAKAKGDYGEEAALAVVAEYSNLRGSGTIYHSFSYKYASDEHGRNYPGNIHHEKGKFTNIDGNSATKDEIDILFITPNRIFAIEAKARAGRWKLFDFWCKQNSTAVDKSPIAQAEKHARHLYHTIYATLPDGNPDYIIPITVFIDKATITDERNEEDQEKYPIAILNNLKEVIQQYDVPLDYALDVAFIKETLKRVGTYNEY